MAQPSCTTRPIFRKSGPPPGARGRITPMRLETEYVGRHIDDTRLGRTVAQWREDMAAIHGDLHQSRHSDRAEALAAAMERHPAGKARTSQRIEPCGDGAEHYPHDKCGGYRL